jgi:Zn-dependent peptidase ImmA (M78 family)
MPLIAEKNNMSLSKEEIKVIEEKARDLICDAFDVDNEKCVEFPLDLGKILNYKKIQLIPVDESVMNNQSHSQDIPIGAYDSQEKRIYVVDTLPYTRLAFTIAHELGHHILHQESDIYYRSQYFKGGVVNKKEQEANWFAASLLMPEDVFKAYWNSSKDINRLASYFGVSKMAAKFRLENLNLK